MANKVQGSLEPYFSEGSYIWPSEFTTFESYMKVKNQLTLQELIPHPQLYALLKDMLQIDHRLRISCWEALKHEFFKMKL